MQTRVTRAGFCSVSRASSNQREGLVELIKSFVSRLADPSMDNSERVKGHKQDFKDMDLNADSNLDATEVKEFYVGRSFFMTQEDVSAFFIASDKDEDGLISEEEYVFTSLLYDDDALDLNDFKFR